MKKKEASNNNDILAENGYRMDITSCTEQMKVMGTNRTELRNLIF